MSEIRLFRGSLYDEKGRAMKCQRVSLTGQTASRNAGFLFQLER
ncbi:hypothetical protein V1498_14505 [Peribacillus sp. SCS-26]